MMRDWDEDTIARYLDGELDAEDVREFEAALLDDARLRGEVERLSYVGGLLRAAAAAQLRQRTPDALTERIMRYQPPRPAASRGAVRWAAAIAVLLAVGGTAGYGGYQVATVRQLERQEATESGRWLTDIAAYHQLYEADSKHLVEVPGTDRQYVERWLSERLARPLMVPDLVSAELEFEGARLLAVNNRPVAQLMYLPFGGGRPVAVCITRTGEADHGPRFTARDGVGLLYWRRGGDAMVIVGWADESRLRAWHTLIAPVIAPPPDPGPPPQL